MNWLEWNRRRYDFYAPLYDPFAKFFRRARQRSIAGLALQPGERVLLLGAGTGLDLALLPAGLELVAIDLSPGMLGRLERRARELGYPVTARVGNVQALDVPDASFDVVIAHLILAVVPDPFATAREVARVLRPGGRLGVFDKFLPDDGRASIGRRLLNQLARLVATEINRQLGPMLAGTGLTLVERQPLFGPFERALARKSGPSTR